MKSLFKALDIIETLAEAGEMGIRELSAATGYPPATTHRIVSALGERSYLRKMPESNRYSLSPKFLLLADSIQERFEIALITRPHLEKLMRQSGENANLCVRNGVDVIYIDHVHSRRHNLRIFTHIGANAPLHATGVGKIFLSWMAPDQFAGFLERIKFETLTPHTITDPDDLRDEIEKIKKQGYALDDQEKELGVRCIAAPLMNHRGEVVAAISISGAAQRISDSRLSGLADMVKETARTISNRLGYSEKRVEKE
ncbi:MAG: IclR family transcriptional regulator [Deltaproteobacteria bacterium]|nr:IclR family transcriptional regulator [Deltaproteobacteria bacterium]